MSAQSHIHTRTRCHVVTRADPRRFVPQGVRTELSAFVAEGRFDRCAHSTTHQVRFPRLLRRTLERVLPNVLETMGARLKSSHHGKDNALLFPAQGKKTP